MTNEGHLPPGHSSVEKLELNLPGIPQGGSLSVCMPLVYGTPSISAIILRCLVCSQSIWVSGRAIGVDLPRVCWDCVEDQVPGFVERKLSER